MLLHSDGQLRKYDGLHYYRPGGSSIPVEVYSRGKQTNESLRIVGLVRDVFEREMVRKRLEASEKEASLLFENSPISMAIYKPDGQFVRANKAHDKLWGGGIKRSKPRF